MFFLITIARREEIILPYPLKTAKYVFLHVPVVFLQLRDDALEKLPLGSLAVGTFGSDDGQV